MGHVGVDNLVHEDSLVREDNVAHEGTEAHVGNPGISGKLVDTTVGMKAGSSVDMMVGTMADTMEELAEQDKME